MTEIRPWRELYEEDQDSNENGMSSFSPDSYMQDEIDALRAELGAAEQRNAELGSALGILAIVGKGTTMAAVRFIAKKALNPTEETPCLPCSPP